MHVIKAKNIADAYHGMAHTVLSQGVHQENGTTEVKNVLIEVDNPMQNTYVPNRDMKLKWGLPVAYMIGELLWSGKGDNSLAYIAQFSKFWNHLSEDGKTVNSAYGYIATKKFGFNQIDKMVEELKRDPNSRRCTLNINVPRTPGTPDICTTKDEWCTMYLQFALNDDKTKVDMTAVMRSNDIWFGFPTDYTYFLFIQYLVARGLGLEVGSYTHMANSLHVYDNHLEDLQRHITDWNNPNQKYKNWTIDYDMLLSSHTESAMCRTRNTILDVLYEEFKPENALDSYNRAFKTELKENTDEVNLFTRKALMTRCEDLGVLRASSVGNEYETLSSTRMYTPPKF